MQHTFSTLVCIVAVLACCADAFRKKQIAQKHVKTLQSTETSLLVNQHTNETLAQFDEMAAFVKSNEQGQANANAIIEGVPYIIRNKYPKYFNAELSWSRHGSELKADLNSGDPVDWGFKKSGRYWRIVNLHPSSYRWELSWSCCVWDHRYATVKRNDPVDWELVPKGGNIYRIVNRHPSHSGWELSWDYINGRAMASVEANDPVDWEIIPAVDYKGHWKFYDTSLAEHGSTWEKTVQVGTSKSNSWTRSSSFSWSVSATASHSAGPNGGAGFESTVSASGTTAEAYTEALSKTRSEGVKKSFTTSDTCHAVFQWIATVESNHQLYELEDATDVTTSLVVCTRDRGTRPKCMPGYCKQSTGCQQCASGGQLR